MVHGKYGTAANETLYVSGHGISNHQLWGLGGDDVLYGWTQANPDLNSNDEIYGDRPPVAGQIQYNPATHPAGQPGNDVIYGGGGSDRLYGDEGNDLIFGDQAFGGLSAPSGQDKLEGGDGDDWLYGGGGNDSLLGGRGKDYLDGAFGGSTSEIDTLTGGADADTFGLGYTGSYTEVKYLGSGYAVITDFDAREGDKIRIGGSRSDYTLDKSQNLVGGDAADTAIYRSGDLIAVVQDNTDVLSLRDLITPIAPETIQVEAENMSLSTYRVEANSAASGGQLVSLRDASGDTGGALLNFSGPSGFYDVLLNYVDENDGQAQLNVQVNGVSVDSWVLDQNFGSGDPLAQTFTQRDIGRILLEPGDTIAITGTRDRNEWARVDSMQLIPLVGVGQSF
ncbi:MAG: hypothetical protein Kow00121_59670 [Elainellaceae cyanobacterium]